MTEADLPLYCSNHPSTETSLRCNRCEKPICAKCATLTPTGYRCQECIRGQQKIFETTQWYDYLAAPVAAGILSLVGSWIVPRLGFFTLFLTPVAGMIIAEVARFLVKHRRSKRLSLITSGATALGSLPILLLTIFPALGLLGQGRIGVLGSLLWQGLYTFIITTTVYYRFGGINIDIR